MISTLQAKRPLPVSRRWLNIAPRFIVTFALAILWAIPVFWMLLTAFKPESQIVTVPPRILPEQLSDFTLGNFINVLLIPRGVDLLKSFMNSVVVSAIGTFMVVVVDILAAYAFA